MTWQQFLTEKVLGECWNIYVNFNDEGMCQKCGDPAEKHAGNRTFTTRSDLMVLYAKIYEDGKWTELVEYLNNIWWIKYGRLYDTVDEAIADYNAWLFCLNGEGYAERNNMVAEFYGWEGEK